MEERTVRLRREADAKRVNDEIEERIKQDRAAWKTHKNMFKLLLLGQSESGASPSCSVPFFSPPSPVPLVLSFHGVTDPLALAVAAASIAVMTYVLRYGELRQWLGNLVYVPRPMSVTLLFFAGNGHAAGSAITSLLFMWLCLRRRLTIRQLSFPPLLSILLPRPLPEARQLPFWLFDSWQTEVALTPSSRLQVVGFSAKKRMRGRF